VKAATAPMRDNLSQLVLSHLAELGGGELSQKGSAGGTKEVGEGLYAPPVAALEESVGLEAHLLPGQVSATVVKVPKTTG